MKAAHRAPNTDRAGRPFGSPTIHAVWRKAHPIEGRDPAQTRRDKCGATIRFTDYGRTDSATGWEIDHISPVSRGGSDDLSNLQPLHWKNNRKKGDSPNSSAYCVVRT